MDVIEMEAEGGELDRCGDEIRQALQTDDVRKKVEHLSRVRDIFAKTTQMDDLLDSYLDELLEFIAISATEMRVFIVGFIELICQRDCNVMKKAIRTYTYLLLKESTDVCVTKAIMRACAVLYPYMLNWAIEKRNDREAEKCWEAFLLLKAHIMNQVENDNEGIRTMTFKFLECVVLAQSMRTEFSAGCAEGSMCLNKIPADHRFISFRQLQSEANHSLQALLEQTTLPHISGQNLLAVLGCIINIARQRPDFMGKVLDSIEILHVNLPPTLGTSQVKSVRKELKMHLLRLLKHHGAVPHNQHITTLLVDLGATPVEIQRNTPSNISELIKKRKRQADDEQTSQPEGSIKKSRSDPRGLKNASEIQGTSADASRILDDDDYADDVDMRDEQEEKPAQQTAIDITAKFVFERLNPKVVANLVIISLVTLPDEMPSTFQSSYTPIAAAGTESQRRHLSRMIATQATAVNLGPGIEQMRKEKLKEYQDRQSLRSEGGVIPPTPMHTLMGQNTNKKKEPSKMQPVPEFIEPMLPTLAPSIQEFDILKDCVSFTKDEMNEIFECAFQSVMNAEIVARKSNMYSIHNKILVRLATRFHSLDFDFTEKMVEFIVAEHKSRADLAILWLAELYAQYQGYSVCFAQDKKDGRWSKEEKLDKYDKVMTYLVKAMFEDEMHKEMAFHRIFLEAPLITANALHWLKMACLDEVYGTFCMTTLREMIMTRSRQRDQLIDLLFQLSHYNGTESCTQAVAISKELYELSYVRDDVTRKLVDQLNACLVDPPPRWFAVAGEEPPSLWTDKLYRAALQMYLDLLPVDPSLIHRLTEVYANCTTTFKRATLSMIETPVKLIGMKGPDIKKMVEECPINAETLVARIIHVLSEKSPVTSEIVAGMRRLHHERNTDVRSLIPVLTGLPKDEILRLLPSLLLSPNNQKSVVYVFKRILQGRNIETSEPPLHPIDCIVEYHKLIPADKTQQKLHADNLEVLYSNKMMSKDIVSAAVERLLEDRPLCALFFRTLVVVNNRWPALDGFISNVLSKVVNRELWKTTPEQKSSFFKALDHLQSVAYPVILTGFNSEEFAEYLSSLPSDKEKELLSKLNYFLPQLSTHQQRNMSQTILDMVKNSRDSRSSRGDRSGSDRDTSGREERVRNRRIAI